VHLQIIPDSDGRSSAGEQNITAHPWTAASCIRRASAASDRRIMTLTVRLTDTTVTLGPVKLASARNRGWAVPDLPADGRGVESAVKTGSMLRPTPPWADAAEYPG